MQACLSSGASSSLLEHLGGFYSHLGELARGYVKDPHQREAQLRIVDGWKSEVAAFAAVLSTSRTGLLAAARSQ